MDDSVEASGRTVEEAVEQALLQLGLSRDEVEVEVLAAGTRGRFGRRSEAAQVVVRPLATSGVVAGKAAVGPGSEGDEGEEDEEGAERDGAVAAAGPPLSAEEAVERAQEILRELLRLIDIEATVTARPPETAGDGLGQAAAVLDVYGEDLGLLIGRRGETLAALQYMVNLLLNHGTQGRLSVTVDVEEYRRRRERRLLTTARRAADDVKATGETIELEPMPANERRIVHLALAEDAHVTTSSVGSGLNRRVAISPSDA